MSILKLPEELIRRILSLLDTESVVSFGRAHPKIQNVVIGLSDSMKVEVLSDDVLRNLEQMQHIRSLDLSNCLAPENQLREAILYLPNLVSLAVVNTRLTYPCLWEIIGRLTNLECLSFTMLAELSKPEDCEIARQALSNMTRLSIEVRPTDWSLEILIEILNECRRIRWFYVNVMGRDVASSKDSSSATQLSPTCWQTLRAVVVSLNVSDSHIFHRRLLRRVFAPLLDKRLIDWIDDVKKCYIFEKGYINEEMASDPPARIGAELVGKVREFDLKKWPHDEPPPLFSQASPRELRLSRARRSGRQVWRRGCPFFKNLVEVDLSGLHMATSGMLHDFPIENLEALTLPACFSYTRFYDFSQTRRLRRLTFIGNTYDSRDGAEDCRHCDHAFPSQIHDNMSSLTTLEELTFDGIRLQSDAFIYWGELSPKTVRLNVNDELTSRNLHALTQRLPNLQYFKVKAPHIDLNFHKFSAAFLRAKKLKQLCLEATHGFSLTSSIIQRWLKGILPRLETLHMHAPTIWLTGAYSDIFELPVIIMYEEKFFGHEYDSMDSEFEADLPQVMPGRRLCFSGGFIGFATPAGWD